MTIENNFNDASSFTSPIASKKRKTPPGAPIKVHRTKRIDLDDATVQRLRDSFRDRFRQFLEDE